MNKKLLELLDKINDKKGEVRSLVDQGKIEEAKAAKDELKKLQDEFDILKDIDDTAVTNLENNTNKGVNLNQKKDSVKEFADAARKGFRNSMNEGTAADGGYTVPEDIQTRINERRTAKTSLIDLVDVENVTTNKGARTFKKRTQQTGFTKIGEGGKLSAGSTPQFERMNYEIAKYAGYFPVTNELLEDSDANITDTLVTWIGDESRVTRNKIILGVIDQKAKTTIKSLDDIKEALNVTLGQAFKQTSCIVTNDDGLQWFDTLKNDRGEYLLQPSPADPIKMVLCAGATTVPVKVIPNDDMPSDTTTKGTTKIPVIIGDLKEGIKFFDRKRLTLITSNIAVAGELNAFEEDLTLFRAIEREDCKTKDDAAFVNGVLTITEVTE